MTPKNWGIQFPNFIAPDTPLSSANIFTQLMFQLIYHFLPAMGQQNLPINTFVEELK